MSIKVENNLKSDENKELFEQKAHYIPCTINENGPANVDERFEPYIGNDSEGMTASFRGRPLNGTKMSLPKEYNAAVVTETKRPLSEDATRTFQVVGGFKEINYWNYDKIPSKNDNLAKAMDWIDISEAIHSK